MTEQLEYIKINKVSELSNTQLSNTQLTNYQTTLKSCVSQ